MTTLYILQAIQAVVFSFLLIKVNKELRDIFQTTILQAKINDDLNKRVKTLETGSTEIITNINKTFENMAVDLNKELYKLKSDKGTNDAKRKK